MESLATTDDLEGMYRLMDADELKRADALLEYASAKILSFMSQNGVKLDADDEVQATLLRCVCCACVHRALESPESEDAVTAWGGAAVYSPTGDVYLTTAERNDILGTAGCQRMFSIQPMKAEDHV